MEEQDAGEQRPGEPIVTAMPGETAPAEVSANSCNVLAALARQLKGIDLQLAVLNESHECMLDASKLSRAFGQRLDCIDQRLAAIQSLQEQQHSTLVDYLGSVLRGLQDILGATVDAVRGGRKFTKSAQPKSSRRPSRSSVRSVTQSSGASEHSISSATARMAPLIGPPVLESLHTSYDRLLMPASCADGDALSEPSPSSTIRTWDLQQKPKGHPGSPRVAPVDRSEPRKARKPQEGQESPQSGCLEATASVSLGDEDEFVAHLTSTSMLSISLDDMSKEPARFILMPSSTLRLAMDAITALATVITGVSLPFGLAYAGDHSLTHGPLGALLCIVDMAWITNIIANFRTAFIRAGTPVVDARCIARRYAHSWLTCDLLAAFPLVLASGDSTFVMTMSLAKLARLCHLGPLVLKFQSYTSIPLYPGLVALIVTLACNSLTCGWRAVRHGDDSTTEPDSSWFDLYVQDAYFVMMVMSTVGFGDIYPRGAIQQLYAILTMVIAPLIFGAIVSLVSHAMEGRFNDKFALQVTQTVQFMKSRGVPQGLQRRVQHNLRRNVLQERTMTLSREILGKLSPAVQRELLSELLRSTVLQFPLFQGANNAFIGEIAQAHSWVDCLSGDIVVEDGQLIQEVVFVIRGNLILQQICHEPCGTGCEVRTTEDIEAPPGAWFGEVCLFQPDRIRDFVAVAVIESELAVLLACDYHRIVSKYPRVLSRHRQIAAELYAGKLSFKLLAYKRPAQIRSLDNYGVSKLFSRMPIRRRLGVFPA